MVPGYQVLQMRFQGGGVHPVLVHQRGARFTARGLHLRAYRVIAYRFIDIGVSPQVPQVGRGRMRQVMDEEFPFHIGADSVF